MFLCEMKQIKIKEKNNCVQMYVSDVVLTNKNKENTE